jgi:hypothetical protein
MAQHLEELGDKDSASPGSSLKIGDKEEGAPGVRGPLCLSFRTVRYSSTAFLRM